MSKQPPKTDDACRNIGDGLAFACQEELLPWTDVAAEYRRRHPGEPMSRAMAWYVCRSAERKLREGLAAFAADLVTK